MSKESREIKTMRYMAWERAKGELRSMLQTYWEEDTFGYCELEEVFSDFIKKVEDRGLQE